MAELSRAKTMKMNESLNRCLEANQRTKRTLGMFSKPPKPPKHEISCKIKIKTKFTPNLTLWTGSYHNLLMEFKDEDIKIEGDWHYIEPQEFG